MAARKRCRGFAAPGMLPAAAGARLSGLRASRDRQNHTDRSFRLWARRSRQCARPVRGVLRYRRAYLPVLEAIAEAVPQRQRSTDPVARRGSDLAAAATVAQHRRRARRAATGARGRRPGAHAARDGRAARPLHGEIVLCCSSRRTCTGAITRPCSSWTTSPAAAAVLDCCGSPASALTEIIARDHPLRAVRHELRLHGLSEEIVLHAFSEREVAEYLAARIPAFAAEEALVRALHGRTDGLPLFVADVVSDLIAQGEPGIEGDSSALVRLDSMAVPETLTGIIERYIQQLTPGERALLEAASVCGVEFRSGTVARMLERDVASLAEVFAELTRQQRWLIEVPLAPCAGVPHAGMFSGRAVPGGALRAHRPTRSCRAPSQSRGCAGARTRGGTQGQRGRAGVALRARPRPDAGVALLRRSRRVGAAAFQPLGKR